jgi:hypothetical protein
MEGKPSEGGKPDGPLGEPMTTIGFNNELSLLSCFVKSFGHSSNTARVFPYHFLTFVRKRSSRAISATSLSFHSSTFWEDFPPSELRGLFVELDELYGGAMGEDKPNIIVVGEGITLEGRDIGLFRRFLTAARRGGYQTEEEGAKIGKSRM